MSSTEQQAVQDAADAFAASCIELDRRQRAKKDAEHAYELACGEFETTSRQVQEARDRLLIAASRGRATP